MRVLVTGATGFIGSNILRHLVTQGHEVLALSRTANHSRLELDGMGIDWIQCDLMSGQDLHNLLDRQQPQGLIHCAWTTRHKAYWNDSSNIRWLAQSLVLFDSFARFGGNRLLVIGTSAEYEWGVNELLSETHSQLLPDSLYGVCKNALRATTLSWADQTDVCVSWARIFNVFGARENPDRLVPRVIRGLLKNEPVMFDEGEQVRDFLEVSQAGSALAALFSSRVRGAVNVASGRPITVRALIEKIADIMGSRQLLGFDAKMEAKSAPRCVSASTQRLKNEVGWQPSKSLDDQLCSTINWWKKHDGGYKGT